MEFIQKAYNMVKAVSELESWYTKQQDVLAIAWTSIGKAWADFLATLDSAWDQFAGFFQQLDAALQVAMNYFDTSTEGKSIFETVSDFFKNFINNVFYRDMSEEPAPAAAAAAPPPPAAAAAAPPPPAAAGATAANESAEQASGPEQVLNPAEILARTLSANLKDDQSTASQSASRRPPSRRRGL